jgi:hypothetical protein
VTRRDFGFVVSRALAVWAFVLSAQNSMYLIAWLPVAGPETVRETLILCATLAFAFGVAWLLWFRADMLAGSLAEEPAGVAITAADLFEALAATVGLYYFASGVTRLLYVTVHSMLPEEAALRGSYGNSWVEALAELVVGAVVVLWSSPRARRAISGLWSVEEVEEVEDRAHAQGDGGAEPKASDGG